MAWSLSLTGTPGADCMVAIERGTRLGMFGRFTGV